MLLFSLVTLSLGALDSTVPEDADSTFHTQTAPCRGQAGLHWTVLSSLSPYCPVLFLASISLNILLTHCYLAEALLPNEIFFRPSLLQI